MSSEQYFQLATIRCLAVLRRYHDGGRTDAAKERMALEVEVIIGWLMEVDLPAGLAESGILRPVGAGLAALYGEEAGGRLNREFSEVFSGAGMPLLYRPDYKNVINNSYINNT